MQTELKTTYPLLDIHFVGVNWAGLEGNAQFTKGKSLPWLQDVDADEDGKSDAWTAWNVGHLDLAVLDGSNEPAAFTNLITYGLGTPENYTALREGLIEAAMRSQKPWQNSDDPLDVDDSGAVLPLDALIVINRLNSVGSERLPPPTANQPPLAYYDTNGDGESTPLDVLLVINFLNARSQAASGEGESFLALPQLWPEDGAAAPVRREGMVGRACSGEHSPDRFHASADGPATASQFAEALTDAAREAYADRVFGIASSDWLSLPAALLDAGVNLDLLELQKLQT